MNRSRKFAALALILGVGAFSIVVAWPADPDRYFPDFVPWPSGGLDLGGDREGFRLGLDLSGGVSVTLEASGEAVPLRTGETLEDFVARSAVPLVQILDLNPELDAIAEEDYDQPLPASFNTLVLPLPSDEEITESIDQARDIIEERVNGFGISEAEVTLIGPIRINAQIPGVDAEQASGLVGSTAQLEFREVDPIQPSSPPPLDAVQLVLAIDDVWNPLVRAMPEALESEVDEYFIPDPEEDVIEVGGQRWIPALGRDSGGVEQQLTGGFLERGSIGRILDSSGAPALTFELDRDGARLMEQITTRLAPSQDLLGIFVDGQIISAPRVNAVISDSGIITGLSAETAASLGRQLRAGALPINFRVIQTTEVAATLGEDSVTDTVQAGLVGFLAIVIFMIVYYRLPGVMAALALIFYAAVVMVTFKLVPITLTLAGIAGLVISIGFAVDGNILIFERMKEELRLGRSLQGAIETGWARAYPAIRDANVSTLITVVILWLFADALNANLIKSFALALLVGTAFSFVTVLFVTRVFMNLLVGTPAARRPGWFGIRTMTGEGEPAAAQPAGGGAGPGGGGAIIDNDDAGSGREARP